jgi:hypothetical protein
MLNEVKHLGHEQEVGIATQTDFHSDTQILR